MLNKKILLVEDEENFGSLLQNYLKLSKYDVDWAKDGALGYSAFVKGNYDLCIFDVMMPNLDGFSLTEKIRKRGNDTPILFLTAKNLKEDILKGYKLGACDYLVKPFDVEVLIAKLDAIFNLERTKLDSINQEKQEFEIGAFKYNSKTRLLVGNEESKKLSPKEGALLNLLCQFKNDVMPREIALKEIWKEDNYFTTRSMDVYITKLRKYLRSDERICIENVHSSGYSLIVQN